MASDSKCSSTFCILPWIHLHALPDSAITPCGLWPYDVPVGNAKKDSLPEIWNSPLMRELRQKMLKGEASSGCSRCYSIEEAGLMSRRQISNRNFEHLLDITKKTEEDGSLQEVKIASLDLRFSNLCNFSCRGCNAYLSNSWYNDQADLLEVFPHHPKTMSISQDAPDFWDQMKKMIPFVEEIYFAGGEPLLMPEHFEVLKILIDSGRTDVRLVYNTNLSTLDYRQQSLCEIWNKFDDVYLSLSLDDLDKRAEYFRHGTLWPQIVENLNILRDNFPKIKRGVFCTVSLFNVYYLPELVNWLVSNKYIEPKYFEVNILFDPPEYSMQVLPPEVKAVISKKLQAHCLLWRTSEDAKDWGLVIYEVQSIIRYLNQKDEGLLLSDTIYKIKRLDKIRSESFVRTYPEMAKMLYHTF